MKKYRTKAEWSTLIREQEKSGKTAVAFCRERNIHPNLFYKKRRENKAGRFVKLPESKSIVHSSLKIRIQDVIIEPGPHARVAELKSILQAVIEVVHAHV